MICVEHNSSLKSVFHDAISKTSDHVFLTRFLVVVIECHVFLRVSINRIPNSKNPFRFELDSFLKLLWSLKYLHDKKLVPEDYAECEQIKFIHIQSLWNSTTSNAISDVACKFKALRRALKGGPRKTSGIKKVKNLNIEKWNYIKTNLTINLSIRKWQNKLIDNLLLCI